MNVDIWSDIRCPFCFIGKRKFEAALETFAHRDHVNIIWHSFQLDPGLTTQPGLHVFDYLAKVKGITRDEAVEMHNYVIQSGREVGIHFNFEQTVVANSFNAHRLIQLAKSQGMADRAEEELFHAHFISGKNIDDAETLSAIGVDVGLQQNEVRQIFSSQVWSEQVKQDEMLARSIGIRGVPFFIFDGKLAVSGAQPPEVFRQTLAKAWEDQTA